MKNTYRAQVSAKLMKKIRNGTTKCSIEKVNTKKTKEFTNKLFCKHISMYSWGYLLVT